MTNQSPPMGRMLRRAIPDTPAELRWIESGRVGLASNGQGGFIMPLVIRGSLNTTGRLFRIRELQWYYLKNEGLNYIMEGDFSNEYYYPSIVRPVTKKDILDGYLTAGRYGNFKTPIL